MIRRLTLPILAVMLLVPLGLMAVFFALPVVGQNNEADERSRFLAFVEDQLSAPGREIRITGIEGALSSNAQIGQITLADDAGVWLSIENASIVWTRTALFRGRLEIESLAAERIDWPRMPEGEDSQDEVGGGSFELPELPVAIRIGQLELGEVLLGEPLFGLSAVLSGAGAISLDDGELDSRFDVTRLDGPGGRLSFLIAYDNATARLDLDALLDEPADGVVANLLNLEGRPPVSLALQGSGPLDDLGVGLALDADGERVLSGDLTLQATRAGRRFDATLDGPISSLVSPTYRAFFGDRSSVLAQGLIPSEGGVTLERLSIESGVLALEAAAATAPDGFLTSLQLDGRLQQSGDAKILLPVGGADTRIAGGQIQATYGLDTDTNTPGGWQAALDLEGFETGDVGLERLVLRFAGDAANLADADQRSISFAGEGLADGIVLSNAELMETVGRSVRFDASGFWQAQAPLSLQSIRLTGDAFQAALSGSLEAATFDGAIAFDGLIRGERLNLTSDVGISDKIRALSNVVLSSGQAQVTGAVSQDTASGLFDGTLTLDGQNIDALAALGDVDAQGAVEAQIGLSQVDGAQAIDAVGTASNLSVAGNTVGAAQFDIDVRDAFGAPQISGDVAAQTVRADAVSVQSVDANLAQSGAFSVAADGVRAPQLTSAGLPAASVRAEGRYANEVIALNSATLRAGTIEARASGRVAPFTTRAVDMQVAGSVPLAFAESFVADRGIQLRGTANLDARVTGTMDAPSVAGSVSVRNGGLVDPLSNVRLSAITVDARLTASEAIIDNASAQLASGGQGGAGSLSAAGQIGLRNGFPANLRIGLNQARYSDGDLVVATANGDLALTGPLAGGGRLSGALQIVQANIQIPSRFASTPGLIDVEHINPSDRVQTSFERALGPGRNDRSGAPALALDVAVSAPNKIYVRGRGVDAELGGQVRLGGTTRSIQPVGAFNLQRGRIDVLGQRIALDDGSITLIGDLDPFIDISASTDGDDIAVVIGVRGRASDPQLTLSSSPELPQDEVLARLIFGRSLNELSPLQVARLALAADELADNSGSSIIGSLRDSVGLSDLDIITDESGSPAVRARQYVQDNIYLGVEASTNGSARTTINLDVTDDITTRGSVRSDGQTSLGIFFERDY
ncbi:MAG: translocation/assembly module TamB domain-containing protein [Pseudomonadota bacterium]